MLNNTLKQQSYKGLKWSIIERFSVQGVSFIFMIFLARLLTPEDYGIVGMLSIFMAIAQALIDSGFTNALIRKQNRTEEDNCTVFYFNIVVGSIIYILLFLFAPIISDFYNQPILTSLTKILSFVFLFNSLSVVQRALLTVDLDFKTQAKAGIIATFISGIIGICLALLDYGVWAIVGQQVSNSFINTVFLWIYCKWKPQLMFSWRSFNELFSFGSKLLGVSLLDGIWKNIYPLVIGKLYDPSSLGHYTRASQFSQFPSNNLNGIIQRVTYPLLCKIQDDTMKLCGIYRKILRLSAFVVFPLMLGLSACSQPLITILLGEKWHFCATLLSIICFDMMWYPVHSINLSLLQVKGRSDYFLKLEFIKKGILIVALVISSPFGVLAMCVSSVFVCYISLYINTYYTGKILGMGFLKQMNDIMPIFLVCLLMWGGITTINIAIDSNIIKLTVDVFFGVLFYITITKLLKFPEWKFVVDYFQKRS